VSRPRFYDIFRGALLLPLVLSLSCRNLSQAEKKDISLAGSRPNIVVILTDDQGYGEISGHGNAILKTPNLDRLRASSLRFTRFHASPTCAPTRAALLTGRHEFRSGVSHTIFERERLSLRAKTLPELLRSAGYTTGIFGKWHLGDEDEYLPNRRGFDEAFIHGGGGIGQTYPGSCGDAPDNGYFDPAIWHNDRFVKTRGYCTDVFFDQAAQWISTRKNTRPFFAWVAPNAPHDPFISPGAEWEAPFSDHGLGANAVKYYAMIAHLDAAVDDCWTGSIN
jgi:arylsulfatase A-like enzyme